MVLSDKVLVLPNICGIEIDATGTALPTQDLSLQPFYNTYVQNATPKEAYYSPSKVSFNEDGKEGRSGIIYTQKLVLQFPSNDPLRVMRLNEYLKAKYIYIKLSGGLVFYFGRNDYKQNSKPKVAVKSNTKITQITYTLQSYFSVGFTNGSFDFNLSEQFPINFYNL